MEKRTAFTVGGLALLALIFLAVQVAVGGQLASTTDPALTHWLASHRSEPATTILLLVTHVHSTVGIEVMVACAALYLGLARQKWRDALWLVACVESAMLLNVVMKTSFARIRPDFEAPLVHLTTFSFPSGHALASTVLWGCLWLLLPAGKLRRIGAVVVILLIGSVVTSRVYLGAHFLTDVLAGIAEGLFWIAAWSLALPAFRQVQESKVSSVAANPERQ